MKFYRIIKRKTPTERDFLSKAARGMIPRPDATQEERDAWDGLTGYDEEDAARLNAAVTDYGRFLAVIEVSDTTPISAERTFKARAHHTLRGKPQDFLAAVVDVLPL